MLMVEMECYLLWLEKKGRACQYMSLEALLGWYDVLVG